MDGEWELGFVRLAGLMALIPAVLASVYNGF